MRCDRLGSSLLGQASGRDFHTRLKGNCPVRFDGTFIARKLCGCRQSDAKTAA